MPRLHRFTAAHIPWCSPKSLSQVKVFWISHLDFTVNESSYNLVCRIKLAPSIRTPSVLGHVLPVFCIGVVFNPDVITGGQEFFSILFWWSSQLCRPLQWDILFSIVLMPVFSSLIVSFQVVVIARWKGWIFRPHANKMGEFSLLKVASSDERSEWAWFLNG